MDWTKAAFAADKVVGQKIVTNTGNTLSSISTKIDAGTATDKEKAIVEKYYDKGDDGEWRVRQSVLMAEAEKIQRMTQLLSAKAKIKGAYPRQFASDLFAIYQGGDGNWDPTYAQQLRERGYDEWAIGWFQLGLQGMVAGDIDKVIEQIQTLEPPPTKGK
jgi:hypothetical protein